MNGKRSSGGKFAQHACIPGEMADSTGWVHAQVVVTFWKVIHICSRAFFSTTLPGVSKARVWALSVFTLRAASSRAA